MFHGESFCNGYLASGMKCNKKGYYKSKKDDQIYCGRHCKAINRMVLPKNPEKDKNEEKQYLDHLETVEKCRNTDIPRVIVSKLKMMKKPDQVAGYLAIFPNFLHKNRKDGFGCPSLSPKSIGPIIHHMPNLPPAKNLENYHQFAKFWQFELDEKGAVKEEFFQKRKEAYLDDTPYRHKYDRKVLRQYGQNVNIPECSIYYDKEGLAHSYTYLESRYFYCHFYERMAPETADFKKLLKLLNNGYNLNIIGYDGYDVSNKSLMEMYLDSSRPFGHEIVLYVLLTEKDTKKYPWNVFYSQWNNRIYANVI